MITDDTERLRLIMYNKTSERIERASKVITLNKTITQLQKKKKTKY